MKECLFFASVSLDKQRNEEMGIQEPPSLVSLDKQKRTEYELRVIVDKASN
ncbi:hypothetical protein HPE56_07465 [Maribacter sp. ANRC-HE7]|uniref:Uncharacterized protein n=1 Tax=Maribacter aquimaris TaxID=2737171 RepID=A0ABR7UZB0_9FLAO|nr:hypothetical protein [Maribacter aquimaris]MBD0777626.1 hypothetical protein [Maribacter aquimaris]